MAMAVVADGRGGREFPPADRPPAEPVHLADGSVLFLRDLAASDEARLRRFYLGLSPTTLYRRFMTPVPRLPERTLAYLCCAGGPDRGIVVATHGDDIVAEGRFHRLAGTDHAEVAVVVADAWQGRGIGRALSTQLRRMAGRAGVTAFSGAMLADNRAARALLASTTPHAEWRIRYGEVEFAAQLLQDAVPALRPHRRASATPSGTRLPARAAG